MRYGLRNRWVGLALVLLGLADLSGYGGSSTSGPRLDAWQNQARRWGSGVQSGNSSYNEDRVVPLRWTGSLKAGSAHTLTLKYDFQRANGGKFFDSLGAYDATEPGIALASGITLDGTPTRWPIPTDPTLPPGAQRSGSLTTYNVQKVEFGSYSSKDGIRCLSVRITVASGGSSRNVVIAYGAHLASESIWGPGRGALRSPGASGKAYVSLNGAADLNVAINPDALAPLADLRVALLAPASVTAGEPMSYQVRLTNAGPNTASAVEVSCPVSAGTTFLGCTTTVATSSTSVSNGVVKIRIVDLAPGTTAVLTMNVLVAPTAPSTLISSASAQSCVTDPDPANNTASGSSTVIYPDHTPPHITCPPEIVQATDPGICSTRVTFAVEASDDRSEATVTTDYPSGSVFSKGTTWVTATAIDEAGNAATCQFPITVVDLEAPTLAAPLDITVETPSGRCDAEVAFDLPPALDACDGAVEITSDIPSGSTFPIGTTAVILQAVDQSGNRAQSTFRVTVKDPANESWPAAKSLGFEEDPSVPGVLSTSDRQCLTQLDQSRWYRVRVQPGSTLAVTLADLAANYDLVVFKDIAATYAELLAQSDLEILNAAFAEDAFSPAAFSSDALSPAAFSPAAFSPAAFSPAQFSPAAFSPAAFSPAAFSPAAFSPDAYAPAAFSPAAFSPAAFSPAAFSPAAFSPAQFSPAAFSDAQAQSVIGVSAFEGTASEGVVVKTWDATTEFYIRVRGRNGVFVPGSPFQVRAYLFPGACGDLQLTAVDAAGQQLPPTSSAIAGNYRTLILSDPGRMPNDGQRDVMLERLSALAARPEVQGAVLRLDQEPEVAFFQSQADLNPDCPTAKNLAAAAIQRVIQAWWNLNPSLENVVIVGGDAVIPFFRYPDQALLGPERNYVPPVRDFSASQASLRLNYVLGQDAFGARCEVPRAVSRLPIPQLAVGRLVENPADVTAMVDAYLELPGGELPPARSALVTGYDFLADAAAAVGDEWTAGLGAPIDTLISPPDQSPLQGWTADQLRQRLFSTRHDLVFLAGHFNAFGTLAADFSTHLTTAEWLASDADFKNAILISAGCHSGYNSVDADGIAHITPEADWAQACARRQAILVAGTGYQYGDTDFIEYSERLYLDFVKQWRYGTAPVSLGQALVKAKRQYLAGTPSLRGLHEKAYLQATLFGLPMLRVNLPAGRLAPPNNTGASAVAATEPYPTPPGSVLGLRRAELELAPTFSAPRSTVLTDFENGATITATYFEGGAGILNNPAEPILPLEIRNVTVPGTVLRGVGFRGGDYQDLPEITPLTGAATTEIRGVHLAFPIEVFFPIQPWRMNAFDSLCSDDDGATRLAVATAQFRVESAAAVAGTLRRFDRLQFRLYYSDNLTSYPANGPSTPGRSGPPSISEVLATSVEGRLHFKTRVTGNPSAGIQETWVTYTAVQGPLAGHWLSLDLGQNPVDSSVWEADLALDGLTAPADFRFLVQAVNGVGLVAINTRQGRYHIPDLADGRESDTAIPTSIQLIAPPARAAYGGRVTVTALLLANGQPVENHGVIFQIGDQQSAARTGAGASAGIATAVMNIATLPGTYDIKVSSPGGFGLASCWTAATIEIDPALTTIEFDAPNTVIGGNATQSIVATLTTSEGTPIPERTMLFTVEGNGAFRARAVVTDYAGRAPLGPLELGSGNYALKAHFATLVENLPTPAGPETLDLRDTRYLPQTAGASLTIDAEPPTISALTVSPSVLKNPNHKWVDVAVQVTATDPNGPPASSIVSITSNEPVNGLGDGDQAPDWEVTGDLTARLRAERAQNGTGRIYTLTILTRDALGNERRDPVTVFVPKSSSDDDSSDHY